MGCAAPRNGADLLDLPARFRELAQQYQELAEAEGYDPARAARAQWGALLLVGLVAVIVGAAAWLGAL